MISGIESLFRKDNLQNFIFILRSAMLWSPPFLRVLLTAESTDSSKAHFEKMLKILATRKILDVTDDLTFTAEGRQLVEFAYKQIAGQPVNQEPTLFQAQQEQPAERFTKACLEAANQSYRGLVDIILKISLQEISLIKIDEACDFVKAY
ncbi:MAG: hypothetical protein ACKO8M_01775 [Microcystis panniformis]